MSTSRILEMRWRYGVMLTALIFLGGVAPAFGQGSAILTGTVVDNVGAVPGAIVTVTDVATSVSRSAPTTAEGVFRILALPPARYKVKVEMTNFKPITVDEFALLGGEVRDLGKLTLQAGSLSETITVTAEATPVQTDISALQRNITGDILTSVQVKGRDIFGMMKILPGVIDTTASRDFAQWNSGRGLSINGGNSLNKNTTIDGVPVGEEGGDGTTHITPNIDAIGEVNVIASGYTAENGRQSSGILKMTTKSGTTRLKGSGWYNARRDQWNKNDYFRKVNNQPKPFFRVNISGYSIGGPVVIPKVIDSRTSQKKVFFFMSQELTDDLRPTSTIRTNLPTALERAGNFSQTRITNGNIQPIVDPLTGRQFPGNIIPAAGTPGCGVQFSCINPLGQRMLNLLPPPNGILNLQSGQQWTSNDARDQTPLHTRHNYVTRFDTVLSARLRASVRLLFDRDDSITFNRVAPGIGSVNNVFPGDLVTGTFTQVMSPTMVNEMTGGFSHNHWGFRVGKGKINADDYTAFYRANVGLDPPRLEPFGPFGEPRLSRVNTDEWPYLPEMTYGGGDRSNLATCNISGANCPNGYRPSGGSGPLPRWNENYRYTFQDDLSKTVGRHNLKFGFSAERNSKTEPGSVAYAGQYNFGHSADNPLSTGNGFANALLGVYTTYTELSNRVDQEVRHWQTEGYAQDSWRITPRFTLDYGLRVTHAGAVYEVRNMNSAFDPSKWDPKLASTLYRPYCLTPGGNLTCSTANRRAINPITGQIVSQAYAGNTVPGSGTITNGMFTGGLPGKKAGWYYNMPAASWGPRVGFAWDLFGDGKTAIRGSTGIFYNFINRSQYLYNGGPLIARNRVVRNATLDDVTAFAAAGTQFAESPATANLPAGFPLPLHGKQLPPGDLHPETNYHVNIAVQRDVGFSTVVEVAYVGNFGRHFWQVKTANNIPPYAYANVNNLFRGEPISENFLRRDYPGMGAVRYLTTDTDVLDYNAMQLSVQRRLSKGLQMGLAYTLAKAEGVKGWDWLTEELYGAQGIRDRYYGPPSASQEQDRRHVLVVNYSYAIPTPFKNTPLISQLLGNWEASGVTQFTTGNPVTPTCNTNVSGVANTDPSLSGVGVRCELTGEPIFSGYTVDPSVAFADQPHFNLAAFRRPAPVNGIGNLGNAPLGILRNPSWSNWDFTLARRFGVRRANIRLQIQMYNVFNQVEFTTLNATYTFSASGNTSANTGKYTNVNNPFNGGVTLRIDF